MNKEIEKEETYQTLKRKEGKKTPLLDYQCNLVNNNPRPCCKMIYVLFH